MKCDSIINDICVYRSSKSFTQNFLKKYSTKMGKMKYAA